MTSPADRPKVVLDCNVFVQAIAFENSPAAICFRLLETSVIQVFISRPVLKEFYEVLSYDTVLAMSPRMSPDIIADYLGRLGFRASLLPRISRVVDFPRDPKDARYLNLSIAAKAQFLVTQDKDLLSLDSGHTPLHKQLHQLNRQLRILKPLAFLTAIGHEFKG